MKKFLFFFLLLMGTFVSQAYDFSAVAPTGQTLYYNISGSTATVTYPGTSASTQYLGYPAPTGNLSIPETVTYNGTTYMVTSIGMYAFEGCNCLTSVSIGNMVTNIGFAAFRGCCSLMSVTVPNSVTNISHSAFSDCSSLTSISVDSSNPYYDSRNNCNAIIETSSNSLIVGCNTTIIPNSVIGINSWSFNGCNGLSSINIPSSVTSIAGSAFSDCSGLTSISVDSSNSYYDSRNNCNAIIETSSNTLIVGCKNTTIPNSVTNIGSVAFSGCTGLTSITIPNSVTNIGSAAFSGCIGLTSITIPNSVSSIGSSAFSGCNNVDTLYYNARNLMTDDYWYSRSDVHGTYGFRPMTNLRVLVIGDSVQTIPAGAFYNQIHLTNVTIPKSVTRIRQYAFSGCSGLTDVFCENEIAPTLGIGVFEYTNLRAIHIPCAGHGFYNSRWETYANLLTLPETPSFERMIGVSDSACGEVLLQTLPCQDTTTIQAISNYGYHFAQWSDGVTDNPRTFILTQDTTITAEFGFNQYAVIGISADTVMGKVSGPDTADYLQSVTLIAVPNYGYHFTKWSDGVADNPRTFVLIQDTSFVAEFGYNQYVVSGESANEAIGGVAGSDTVDYLQTVTLTATSLYGYHFIQWNDGNIDNPRIIVADSNKRYTAEFGYNQYTVTGASANEVMGEVSGTDTVDYLQMVSLTAVPNHGYHFIQWNDGNTENPRTVVADSNKSYTAEFGNNTYTITKLCNTVKGEISGNSSSNYLSNVTLTAVPNYGYHFTQWNDGVTENPRTFVLTQDTSFTAEFDYNQYTINGLSGNSTLGTVTGGGDFLYLDTVTLTATAVDHYHFARWQDGNTENPRSVVVTGDADYTAIFEIDVYHITVESSDLNMGYVSGGGDVTYGQPVTVEATAYSGYHFSCWSNGSRYNPYTFASIQDLTLQAIFISDEAPFYTITVAANNAAMGSATGSGTYDAGTVALISAVPFEGCAFLHWSDGSTEAARLVEINATATYTAFFAPEQCNVNTTTNIAAAGTVSGNGTYNMGDTVTLTAIANDGYRFDHWSDGSTEEVRTVVIDENLSAEMQLGAGNTYGITFTAYFVDEHEGIDDAALDEVKVYVAEGAIIVAAAENEQVRIYDLSGRIVAEGRIRYEAPTSGVYFVRAGIRKAQKVVVVK